MSRAIHSIALPLPRPSRLAVTALIATTLAHCAAGTVQPGATSTDDAAVYAPPVDDAAAPTADDAATMPSTLADGAPTLPASVLNLTDWKLTLPISRSDGGVALEVVQPALSTFVLDPYFHLNVTNDGTVFRANCNGATTIGSPFARSELREMTANGLVAASWSTTVGTHTMIVKEAVTNAPQLRPEVVAGQIHDATSAVMLIRLEGNSLFVQNNGKNIALLDGKYALGTVFTMKTIVSGGHIQVYYNDVLKVEFAQSSTGCYFKAGCYTLSNTSYGEAPGSYGQVIIYDLRVTHS